MDSPFQIVFALVCDDVRREDTGKLIFIGVYGENITVPKTPANLLVSVVAFLEVRQDFKAQAEIRVRMDDKVLVQAPIHLDYQKGKATTSFANVPVEIEKPGDVTFELLIRGEEGARVLKTIPVTSASAT